MPRSTRVPRHRLPHWTGACILMLAGASCAAGSSAPDGPPAPDTTAAAGTDEPERPVERPYVYEVAPGQERPPATPDTVATIEVSGSAEVEVPTDRARVTFAVETEEGTAREAAEENARWMEAVHSALRESGHEGLEIETFGYSLQPRYRRGDPGSREIDGYRARNFIRVTTADLDGVGGLIDTAVGAGANRVASLAFDTSDIEEARQRALREAVRKARREAETIAEAMGVPLGGPVQVRGGADPPRPLGIARAEVAQAAAPSTPVEPGTRTVEASVTIRYRIGTPEQR